MARYHGKVGFITTKETEPGIWEEVVLEKEYWGDEVQNSRLAEASDQTINNNLNVNLSISIVGNGFLFNNFRAMRYLEWAGDLWEITSVSVQRPRLILNIGGVYNGIKA